MTTTVVPPDQYRTPPVPARVNRPKYLTRDQPHYYDHLDGRPYVIADEECGECDGEGAVEVEVRGGVWTAWQGGMWVPDTRRVDCYVCDGNRVVGIERCARCGREAPECECDDDDLEVFRAEMNAVLEVAARLADAREAAGDVAGGMHVLASVHRVPWNLLHALAAREERPVEYTDGTSEHGPFGTLHLPVGVTLFTPCASD